MWVLKKITDGTTKYLTSEKESYIVGRKNCDILLEGDTSISRKHCSLFIAKKNDCPFSVNTLTGVWVVDENSKYGTFMNNHNEWVKIDANQNTKLTDGCFIRFGLMENIWRFVYKPVIACTSGVQAEQKKEIETALRLIDGELRNAWSKDCSLVIVNEITLTVKVVLAMINGIPIVTPEYVQKLVDSIKNQTSPPEYKMYQPEFKESILDASLVSLDITNTRKDLFKGKKFVIPTKRQLETLQEVITSAGGKVELLSCSGTWERFAEKNSILIQLPLNGSAPEELSSSFKEITTFLKNNHGRRIIPESEIAQAIAYTSIEKYCNPTSTCFNLRRISEKTDLGVVLVEETPKTPEEIIPDPCVIPCSSTGHSQDDGFPTQKESQLSGRKRTHSPEYFESDFPKKNKSSNDEVQEVSDVPPVAKESQQSSESEKPTHSKKNPVKESLITNYFKKRNQESVLQSLIDEQSKRDFWNCDVEVRSLKRKSTDSKSSGQKKVKHSTDSDEKAPSAEAEAEPVRTVDRIKRKESSSNSWPSVRKIAEEDENFDDFIEREKAGGLNTTIDELNNTIYSLTLISSAYLKEDGSLIDPPTVPVNVKKFRKQKVMPGENLMALGGIEEDISGEGWIEPHPVQPHVSVGGRDDW